MIQFSFVTRLKFIFDCFVVRQKGGRAIFGRNADFRKQEQGWGVSITTLRSR